MMYIIPGRGFGICPATCGDAFDASCRDDSVDDGEGADTGDTSDTGDTGDAGDTGAAAVSPTTMLMRNSRNSELAPLDNAVSVAQMTRDMAVFYTFSASVRESDGTKRAMARREGSF